jgi:hypothetical protein
MEPEGTELVSAHGSVQQVVVRLIVIGELYLDLAELAGAPMSW